MLLMLMRRPRVPASTNRPTARKSLRFGMVLALIIGSIFAAIQVFGANVNGSDSEIDNYLLVNLFEAASVL